MTITLATSLCRLNGTAEPIAVVCAMSGTKERLVAGRDGVVDQPLPGRDGRTEGLVVELGRQADRTHHPGPRARRPAAA
jgi:hypothetical protein